MPTKTKVIKNFKGSLSRFPDGDLDSGLSKYGTSFGYDAFSSPNNLTWFEIPVQIDSAGSVITDLIVAAGERVETGVLYVYAIGHTGRLYKIQVNDPNTYNPNYDNPVLLAILTSNSPTFTMGGSLEFFGATERIYIGHDKGVTRIDLDGTNETFVGVLGSYTQNVPRTSKQFLGKIYYGNGNNLVEIDSTATVTTYTKLSPGFPANAQVRDLDVSSDGNYLEIVVSQLALASIIATTPDTTSTANSTSYIFKWNGTDTGYTAYTTYPSFSLTANTTFGNRQYVFGTDTAGACVFNPSEKILSNLLSQSPLPSAVSSNGNIVGWCVPEFSQGFLKATLFLYGPLDAEFSNNSMYRQFQLSATGTETDVIKVPFSTLVSTFNIGTNSNGYAGGVFGLGKFYFSTLETSAGTTKYKLYKFLTVPVGSGTPMQGVYESQNQQEFVVFRNIVTKKFKAHQIRFYVKPLVAGNSFKIELIDGAGSVISGTSTTFTVGTNVTAGQDYVWYNCQMAPHYGFAFRITNLGTVNWTGSKLEIDYDDAGI